MIWVVASIPVDPYLPLKVKEALARRVSFKIKRSSDYSPFSLSWLGYVDGAHWEYDISGSAYGNGHVSDSVIGIITTDSVGSCYKPGTEVAFWVSVGTTDSSAIDDTSFTYFDGTLYSEGGVMVAKYNPDSGDTWEAWDTCLTLLNSRFPIGDIDNDSTVDTAWLLPSTTVVTNITSSELATAISPLQIRLWASSLSSYMIDSIALNEFDRHVFQINFGKVETHTDSTEAIYYSLGSPVLDTMFYDIYHKTLTVDVAEKPNTGYSPIVIGRDVVEVAYPEDYTLSIYTSSGRIVKRFYGSGRNTYRLPYRKGVYFIVFRTKDRALIRPYVR